MIRRGIAVLLALCVFLVTNCAMADNLRGYVTASMLYVRAKPIAESDTIHYIKNGEKVTVLQKVNEWYNVLCEDGTKGYVYAQFINLEGNSTPSTPSGSAAANQTDSNKTKVTSTGVMILPSTLTFGDQGKEVSAIQQALATYGYYKGKIDGIFGTGTLRAVEMFQKDNGLVVDGLVGKATTRTLFSNTVSIGDAKGTNAADDQKSPPNENETPKQPEKAPASSSGSRTKSLNWFGEGQNLLKNNRSITIRDINTGVSWNAIYANGSNHADVYPASNDDARKITNANITGSYVRRPVVVTIAGTNYAGSMYAVPHGNTNYSNYFTGVMCLHFTGSKTHESNRVDADHQKAIQVALAR